MSLRKDLQFARNLGLETALAGKVSYPDDAVDPSAESPREWRDADFLKAAYEHGYDEGRVEFVRLAKAYQAAARLKT